MMRTPSDRLAESLNQHCRCQVVDDLRLARGFAPDKATSTQQGVYTNLFSSFPVFVSRVDERRMAHTIRAIETVIALPAYQDAVLAMAPEIARHDPGTPGVLMGYDFHLGPDGPKLIEINTNAGGAMLNLQLARAQRRCCPSLTASQPGWERPDETESEIVSMFRNEWRAARGDLNLRNIAIVDVDPATQFLHPEFELFRDLFARHGLVAMIADPGALERRAGGLWLGETRIDFVYNRLTDFALQQSEHGALRAAYLNNEIVMTPHPRAHALYADKRNLAIFGDAARLADLGAPSWCRRVLADSIPRTVVLHADLRARLWSERRRWFFKPIAGYGAKAAYRGDKLTRRVFEGFADGQYVAQACVPPSERRGRLDGHDAMFKLDVRNYTYVGKTLLRAVRLYRGQTTNFRTPGGGFAPLYSIPSPLRQSDIPEDCYV